MPNTAKAPEPVIFVSPRATIYKSGKGHPFPPGSKVPLHPEHAAAFAAADLDKPRPAKPEAAPAAAGPAQQPPAPPTATAASAPSAAQADATASKK